MPANLSTNSLTNRLTNKHASMMPRHAHPSAPPSTRPDTRGKSSRSSNAQRAHAREHPHATARTAIANPRHISNLNEADAHIAGTYAAGTYAAGTYAAGTYAADTCKSACTPADMITGIAANTPNHAKQSQPDDRCTLRCTTPRSNTSPRIACSLSSRIAASITALAERIATAAENHRALAERLITAGGILLILIIYGLAALGD